MKNTLVLLVILLFAACGTPSKTKVLEPVKVSEVPPTPTPKKYEDAAEFSVPCTYDGKAFSIEFKSKSGKLENNDMAAVLKFDEETSVPLKIDPALYHRVPGVASFKSFCDGIPAYPVDGAEQVLLIFNVDQKIDGKPSDPETTLVLIDLKTKRVLTKLERIGKLKASDPAHYSVIPAPNGFQIRLLRDPNTRAEDWKWVIIKKASMNTKWMSSTKKKTDY